jgi:hypothetical protein
MLTASAMAEAAAAKVSDFAWMAGTWNGTVGGAPVERVCSAPAGGSMMCMMRVIAQQKVVWTEFSVLRETPNGIVLDTRFYTPDLQPADPITTELRLKGATATEAVFENPNGTQPKMESVTSLGAGVMKSHADLVDEKGQTSAIDAQWKLVKEAASAP